MPARDWYIVDRCIAEFEDRTKEQHHPCKSVWKFDIQQYLSDNGVTHPRAFHEVCEALRRAGIDTRMSD